MNVLQATFSLMFWLTASLACSQRGSSPPAPAKPNEESALCKPESLPPDVQSRLKSEFGSWKVQEPADLSPGTHERWEPEKPLACPGIAVGQFEIAKMPTYAVLLVPQSQQAGGGLAELAVAYGQARPAGATPSSEKAVETPPTSPATDTADSEFEEYESQMANYLLQKNYDALEEAAHQARTNKTRFKGGTWKLYDFYDAVTEPQGGDQAPSEIWDFHVERVKAWELARPDSATAHIALAETYVKYAGQARGGGYAKTVSEQGWKLYGERVALAASMLTEAANLKEKCPYWFEVMQQVALAQGWGKSQARKLLDAAVAFEPAYYHYYREYASFLLPKWYGEPGEAEAFAEEVSNKVGGEQGKFLYFEIASLVTCQCDSDDTNMEYLSWPKIKEGYAALGHLYGVSSLKMNRFAHMAVEAHDKDTAQQAFAAIGDDWDYSVWRSGQNFDNARNWARSQ